MTARLRSAYRRYVGMRNRKFVAQPWWFSAKDALRTGAFAVAGAVIGGFSLSATVWFTAAVTVLYFFWYRFVFGPYEVRRERRGDGAQQL